MVHIIRGDGSIAICGEKFPDEISFLIFEVTCPECLRLHRLEVDADRQRAQQKMHPTLGKSAAFESEFKPAPKRVI